MKVKLPADLAIDPEVDLGTTNGGYLLQGRLNVSLPGIEPEVARKLVDGAHLALIARSPSDQFLLFLNCRLENARYIACLFNISNLRLGIAYSEAQFTKQGG